MIAKAIIFYMLVQLDFPMWCKALIALDMLSSLVVFCYKAGKES